MNKTFNAIALFAVLLCAALPGFGQATMTTTTLSAGIADTATRTVVVASTTCTPCVGGVIAPNSTDVVVDNELMQVTAVSGTTLTVVRGSGGSATSLHNSGQTVYVGPPGFFRPFEPVGGCVATNELVLPIVTYTRNQQGGPPRRKNCINSTWMADDGEFLLPASACVSSVSANSTGTNGLTTSGASVMQVMQASTSATGTNTHTYVCNISPPSKLFGQGIAIIDAVFYYGVQTSALGTQVATLASGTMNSTTVFGKVVFPTPAASETASTVAPVRADAGTLTVTPVVASANTATTTAGAFYAMKFTPATAIQVTNDLTTYFLSVTLQGAATSATVSNSPGVLVHYAYIP